MKNGIIDDTIFDSEPLEMQELLLDDDITKEELKKEIEKNKNFLKTVEEKWRRNRSVANIG